MKRVGEYLRKNVPNNIVNDENPYKAEIEAFDKKYFEEHPDQDGSWPIDPEAAYETKPVPTEDMSDTVPMPSGNEEMDAVNRAKNPKEALREYKSRYPLKDVDAGIKSPQLGAEMLLGIDTKFDETMTPEEKRDVALGKIEMAKRIIKMADKPPEKSPEWVSIKGEMEIIAAIADAEKYAPDEVEPLKQGLRRVINQVELRAPTISGPIMVALEESAKNPDTPFEKIHDEIEYELLNQSNVEFELKDKERQEKEERELAAREVGSAALAHATQASTQAELAGTRTGTAVASLEDLEADDDSKVLVGAGR